MQTAWLLAGAIAFSIIAPGTIAGFIPYAITRWRVQSHWLGLPGQIAGGLMLAAGVLVIAESFLRFVFVGRGTPAPVAPPEGLVVSGFIATPAIPCTSRSCPRSWGRPCSSEAQTCSRMRFSSGCSSRASSSSMRSPFFGGSSAARTTCIAKTCRDGGRARSLGAANR